MKNGVSVLTRREKQALLLVGQGLTEKEAARRLGISVGTLNWHLMNARAVLGVHKSWRAAVEARKAGYI